MSIGSKNKYLQQHVPALYRLQALDLMIYTFIDAQRYTIPGISLKESAIAFTKRFDIDEGDLSIDKIIKTFTRIQKEIYNEERNS